MRALTHARSQAGKVHAMKTLLPETTRRTLAVSARSVRQMQAIPAVIVQQGDLAEIARLKAALAKAEAERDAARNAAAERAHREDRLRKYGLREFDGRAIWAAKMGLTQAPPLVAMTSQRIITADVWEPTPQAK